MNKKWRIVLIGLILAVVLLSGCLGGDAATPTTVPSPEPPSSVPTSPTIALTPTPPGGNVPATPTNGPFPATPTTIPTGPTDTPVVVIPTAPPTAPVPTITPTPRPDSATNTPGQLPTSTPVQNNGGGVKVNVGDCCLRGLAWAPDGGAFAVGYKNGLNIYSAKGVSAGTISGDTAAITSISWSVDGRIITSGSADKTIRYWDTSGHPLQTITDNNALTKVSEVSWSPDGTLLASGSDDGAVRVFQPDGVRLAVIEALAPASSGPIISLSWSPDSKILAISYNGFLQLRTINKRAVPGSDFPASVKVDIVRWIPRVDSGGQGLIATGSADHMVRLWHQDGKLVSTLSGHADAITALAWSPDGKTLASGSKDKSIRLWSQDGKMINLLAGHADTITALAWSPDGKTLVSASDDGTLRIWSIK